MLKLFLFVSFAKKLNVLCGPFFYHKEHKAISSHQAKLPTPD